MIPSQGSNTAAARRVTNRGIAYGKHSRRDDSGPGLVPDRYFKIGFYCPDTISDLK